MNYEDDGVNIATLKVLIQWNTKKQVLYHKGVYYFNIHSGIIIIIFCNRRKQHLTTVYNRQNVRIVIIAFVYH